MFDLKSIGNYPPEYDPLKHGPYDPSRYYGKPDTPFGEVKLGELGAWFSRRNKSPRAFAGLISRGFWRWQMKYVQPKRAGITSFFQTAVVGMILFYAINYRRIQLHKNAKYH